MNAWIEQLIINLQKLLIVQQYYQAISLQMCKGRGDQGGKQNSMGMDRKIKVEVIMLAYYIVGENDNFLLMLANLK